MRKKTKTECINILVTPEVKRWLLELVEEEQKYTEHTVSQADVIARLIKEARARI